MYMKVASGEEVAGEEGAVCRVVAICPIRD